MVLISVQYKLIFCEKRINVRRLFLGQQTNTIIDKTSEMRDDLVLRIVQDSKEEPTDRLKKKNNSNFK